MLFEYFAFVTIPKLHNEKYRLVFYSKLQYTIIRVYALGLSAFAWLPFLKYAVNYSVKEHFFLYII